MLAYVLLLCFLICGVVTMDALFSEHCGIVRLWLGLSAGLVMMMVLPVPYAFALGFTRAAQLCALGTAVLIAAVCRFGLRHRVHAAGSFFGDLSPKLFLILLVPFALLSAYLLYTHTLRPADGGLNVGQSTYGDLCLHLGIATGMRNAAFPPEYTILPGVRIGYPFLADSMVTTMLLFGGDLTDSYIVTGTLMMALVYAGFILLMWELTRSRAAVVIAFLLMFVNGGLGFLYTFDGVFKDSTALKAVFTGFYATPTNMPDLNLRWVNVICDMMIPQRTLLAGWMTLLPALFILTDALKTRTLARFALTGVWAGLMPMIHTHSFFALGLMSCGALLHALVNCPRDRLIATVKQFGIYALCAAVLAGPQLLLWTFPQTLGGSGSSLSLRFNWVNNQGNGRLIDGYFWFWIKNVGLAYIFILPAALSTKRGSVERTFCIGAAVIYAVAELIQFQPNPYDNNKLFYVAYMLVLPALAMYLTRLWKKLSGIRGRALFTALFAAACLTSGTLSIAREVVSDYQLFYSDEVEAAAYIEENLPADAVVLTGDQHNNAVAALTGRKIVCGTGSYLYFHGVDYGAQQRAEQLMLSAPGDNTALFGAYNVSYVYISSRERSNPGVDEAWFDAHCELVYGNRDIRLYAVPDDLA